MNKFTLIICGAFGLATIQTAMGQQVTQTTCYPNAEFMKLIDEKALVTLYNGTKNGKTFEVLMTKDRHIYNVEYEKATDGNALASKQYCVTGIVDDVTFNDSAIEFLSKLLDKYKGQKT